MYRCYVTPELIKPPVDIVAMKKEIAKLKEQDGRYTKAYGAGVYSMDELQDYVAPVKAKIASLESEISKANVLNEQIKNILLPSPYEIEMYAAKATRALEDLNFQTKRAIVMDTVDRVVASQGELQVSGYIPVTNYVEFKTNDRHRGTPERGEVDVI